MPERGQFFGFNNKDPLALRWTALEPGTLMIAINGLNTAKNWDDFRNALKYWDCPSQNVIYADNKGNIGYQMPGNVPIRAKNHNGLLPVPGWTDEYEWKGYIPFDLLPRAYNPGRGYVVTANQAVVPPEYYDFLNKQLDPNLNYNLGYEWNYGYRAQRINQLIKELAPHSMQTFQKMQGDNKLLSVGEVLPYLANIKFSDPDLISAKDWLVNWDYTFNEDSPQAALYAEFWMKLVNNIFPDKLGDTDQSRTATTGTCGPSACCCENPNDTWWDDINTKDKVETRDDILSQSFKEGYAATVAATGSRPQPVEMGHAAYRHFRQQSPGRQRHRPDRVPGKQGAFPGGRDHRRHQRLPLDGQQGRFHGTVPCPSMRMIIDMSDISKSVCMNATGQSGNPASQWYGDMINSWLNVKYHPMLWTRHQVNAGAAHNLMLTP